jgi:hypothetical protein
MRRKLLIAVGRAIFSSYDPGKKTKAHGKVFTDDKKKDMTGTIRPGVELNRAAWDYTDFY